MKNKRKIVVNILFIIVMAFIGYGVLTFTGLRSNLASEVTQQKIEAIEIGMSRDEVISLLGEPLSTDPFDDGIAETNNTVMNYSHFIVPFKSYPMLWVHLQDDQVVGVYAEIHYGIGAGRALDETAVYSLNLDDQWQTAEFETIFPVQ